MNYRTCAFGSCEEPATRPENDDKPVLCARHHELDRAQSKRDDWRVAGEYLGEFQSIARLAANAALHSVLEDAISTCVDTEEIYVERVTELSAPDVRKETGHMAQLSAFGKVMLEVMGYAAAFAGEDVRGLAAEAVRSADAKAGTEFGPDGTERLLAAMYSYGRDPLDSDFMLALVRGLGLGGDDMGRLALAYTYDEYRPRRAV